MGNTLTGLIPVLFEALNQVAREMVGFIPAVGRNMSAERAAVNEPLRIPIAGAVSGYDIAPSVNSPDAGDGTTSYVDMAITKSRGYPVRFSGEDERGLGNAGQYQTLMRDRMAEAMRAAVNEIEADLAAVYFASSRATGTAGSTPFGTDIKAIAQLIKMLKDNGVPDTDLQLVIDTSAGANLRGLSNLQKVNESGTDSMLRQGLIGTLQRFAVRESAQVKYHVKGAGTGYLVNGAAVAKGATTIPVDTGTGAIKAGDIISIAGDANKYVVAEAAASGTTSIKIAEPGLMIAPADNAAITIGADYTANMAFDRSAVQLITRAPAIPSGGDSARDRITITDPLSGLSFEVAEYPQNKQVLYEVGIAWGMKLIRPRSSIILLG